MILSEKNTQLIILDIQGKLSQIVYESEKILQNSQVLVQGCQKIGIPIIWLEQVPEKLGYTHPSIAELLTGMYPIAKSTFSAYGNEAFRLQLQGNQRKQVLLIGVETHICIYQTAVDLLLQGYEVFVIADAVSSRTGSNKTIGLMMLHNEGVKLLSTEAALFALLQSAEHPYFKEIAKLVK